MTLEKLTIHYEKGRAGRFEGTIEALFNPGLLSYSKSVVWEPIEAASVATSGAGTPLEFKSIEPETLNVNLFFDTYGGDPRGSFSLGMLGSTPSVLTYTEKVVALARLDRELHRPPICQLSWGRGLLFQGVLSSVNRTLELFLEDGTPVRASLECSFLEACGEDGTQLELHSADVAKQYVVRPGDTLMAIAAELYGDPALWRRIAVANELDDPRRLIPGRVLAIPRLR
jgi:nucleoid-associated protein YgaU